MIRANISTEIARDRWGKEYQAKDLMDYIEQGSNQPGKVCGMSIFFGKSVRGAAGWRRYADEGIKNDR